MKQSKVYKKSLILSTILEVSLIVSIPLLFIYLAYLSYLEFAPGIQIKKNLPKYGQFSKKSHKYAGIVRISTKEGFICSGVVIDKNYILTAGHCVVRMNRLNPTPVYITSIHKKGRTEGIPVGVILRLDIALIKGDFSKYRSYRLSKKPMPTFLEIKILNTLGVSYITCGFPFGQKELQCIPYMYKGMRDFYLAGESTIIPGMSGGPVINIVTLEVVGINSAAGYFETYAGSVLGILAAFNIE